MYETPQERAVSWVDSQNLWIMALPLTLVAEVIRTVLQIRMSLDEDFRKERYLPKAEGLVALLAVVFLAPWLILGILAILDGAFYCFC